MFSIVRSVIDRIKALFVTHAVLELEAELIAACAERKAELLRRANQYEQEGLPVVAQQLRQQVETLSPDKPLGSVLAAIAHLQADLAVTTIPAEPTLKPAPSSAPEGSLPGARKKNGKS
jgi:hypothetical protein